MVTLLRMCSGERSGPIPPDFAFGPLQSPSRVFRRDLAMIIDDKSDKPGLNDWKVLGGPDQLFFLLINRRS